jgi:metal-responsive CopG/Arc/MetJ family transcriptional regulator
MKRDIVTVRLDSDMKPLLEKAVRRSGRTRSEIVRDALRRHLLILQFEQIRNRVMPSAEARGYLLDEDIFKEIS